MIFYIKNYETEDFHAGNKARKDCEEIFKNLKLQELRVRVNSLTKNKFIGKMKKIFWTLENMIMANKLVKNGDIVFYQFPAYNIQEKYLIKFLELKKIRLIPVIHDLDGLRFKRDKEKKSEIKSLNKSFKIISHNRKMTEYLKKVYKISKEIKELNIFDYLVTEQYHFDERKKGICYAGNLDYGKSPFIYKLNEVKNIEFNIYGINYQKEKNNESFNYCGAFNPEIIHTKLKGEYGLIWDGDSLDECNGVYGEYLKYNNPHKFSLYITAGLPVITWKEAAISSYILEKKIGIVVSSLKNLENELKNISEDTYFKMKCNVLKLREEVIQGNNLKKILLEIIQEEKNEE